MVKIDRAAWRRWKFMSIRAYEADEAYKVIEKGDGR